MREVSSVRCASCGATADGAESRCAVCGMEMGDPGERLGPGLVLAERFELSSLLGQGGIARVWSARDLHLDGEMVACKLLRPYLFDDPDALCDLKREVLLSRRLRHANIVGVYTFWDTGEHRFITMEQVRGVNLAEALRRRGEPFAPSDVAGLAEQLCAALDYAHGKEVLHRDVKPANVLLGEDGTARLADFGVARRAHEAQVRLAGQMTGGTVMYMSPEQLAGRPLDRRSDLYSLASTLYELLSGAPPFHGGSVVTQIQLKPAAPVPGLPEAVNTVLLRTLAKQPERRPESCGVFFEEFRAASTAMGGTPSGAPLAEGPLHFDSEGETVRLDPFEANPRNRLGQMLVEAGAVTKEAVAEALRVQREQGGRLGEVLTRLGHVSEHRIARVLADQLRIRCVEVEHWPVDPAVLRRFPADLARRWCCIPLGREAGRLEVVLADPLDFDAINEVEAVCGEQVELCVGEPSAIRARVQQAYGTR